MTRIIRVLLLSAAVASGGCGDSAPLERSQAAHQASDPSSRVSFSLTGRRLEVRVAEDAPDAVVRRLGLERLRYGCSTSLKASAGLERGTPESPLVANASGDPLEEGVRGVHVTLDADIADRVAFCGIEGEESGDIAVAFFVPPDQINSGRGRP